MRKGKAIIFSAPSGSGKTTIVRHLLDTHSYLGFSISATTRKKREKEIDGKDYYFFTKEEFERKIENKEFIEWEQVYEGLYYGTLKSEVTRLWNSDRHVLFDVDVLGGLNLKKHFQNSGLSVFVKVPSIEQLEERLRLRNTESEENIKQRLERVKYELSYENQFDVTLINDNLDATFNQAETIVKEFIEK